MALVWEACREESQLCIAGIAFLDRLVRLFSKRFQDNALVNPTTFRAIVEKSRSLLERLGMRTSCRESGTESRGGAFQTDPVVRQNSEHLQNE
jgi:hypothetical protein